MGVSLKRKIYIQIWAHLSHPKLGFLWTLGSLLHRELAIDSLYPGLPNYIGPACQKLISQPSLGLSPHPLDHSLFPMGVWWEATEYFLIEPLASILEP